MKRTQRPLHVVPVTIPSSTTRVLRSQTAAQTAAPSKVTKANPRPKTRRRRADPWAPKRKVQPNPKPRQPPRTHFTCRICIEEQTTDQFPTWNYRSRGRLSRIGGLPYECIGHLGPRRNRRRIDPVCKSCIGNTMSARLDLVGARKVGVGCVEPGCIVDWNWNLITKYLPLGKALEKFNMEMFEVWKQEATPKLITCLTPGCNIIGLPDTTAPGYPQISCSSCALRSCAECRVPWHPDLTCSEYAVKHLHEQMSDPEKDTLTLMQTKDGKRCPNCFLVIEKDGGCNSMFCIGCQKYFNWETAGKTLLLMTTYRLLTVCQQHPPSLEPRKLNPLHTMILIFTLT
jgi:hypothetical protein